MIVPVFAVEKEVKSESTEIKDNTTTNEVAPVVTAEKVSENISAIFKGLPVKETSPEEKE